ncbi:oxygenase MpaB family protein [soil metagenome]
MSRSVAFQRYAADGALVLGGGAAILLQIADPVVGAGVAAHSAFADDPMRRLRHTLTYGYAIGLGTAAQSRLAASFVDRAHAGVPGASDPQRQLWVAATLYRLSVDVHELLRGPLDDTLADEIYAASADLGTALQLPANAWPADRAAFEKYWVDVVAALEVTPAARRVARDLLWPGRVPLWVRAAMPLGRTLTAGLLPASIRDGFGLPHDPRGFRRAVRVARLAARLTPRRLREVPSRRLLARL